MRSFEVDMLLYTVGKMNIKGGVTHLKKIMDNFERNLRKLKTAAVLLKEYRKLSWKVFRINFKQCSDDTFDRNLFIRK